MEGHDLAVVAFLVELDRAGGVQLVREWLDNVDQPPQDVIE